MKANELRIGNWINYDNDNYVVNAIDCLNKVRIALLTDIGSVTCVRGHSQIEPIPLTKEWLLKFGFDKVTGWDDYKGWVKRDVEIEEDVRDITLLEKKHNPDVLWRACERYAYLFKERVAVLRRLAELERELKILKERL